MPTCPACRADLSESSSSCAQCGDTPAAPAARRVTFATREVLKQHYDTNLAHHGLVIPSAEPLPEGTELDVQLVLPEEAGTLAVIARVVAAQEAPAAKGGAYELQLQLLDFDEEKHVTVRAVLAGGSPAPTAASPPRPAAAESAPAAAPPPRPTAAESAPKAAPPPRCAAAESAPAAAPPSRPAPAATRDEVGIQIEGLLKPWQPPAASAQHR
jgi:cell pole-organizing protein PopZ